MTPPSSGTGTREGDGVLNACDYRTVVVDPPWTPSLDATWNPVNRKAAPQKHYKTLSFDAIVTLRPRLAPQAHLYVWALTQHVDWAWCLCRLWDSEPVTMFTWKKPGLGAGRFRCNTEHIVVARKGNRIGNAFGSGGRSVQATAGTLFEWPRGRHSEKPDEFFSLVHQLSPSQPRLEMYARSPREGWVTWGDQSSIVTDAGGMTWGKNRV